MTAVLRKFSISIAAKDSVASRIKTPCYLGSAYEWLPEGSQKKELTAIWDTGATISAVDPKLLQEIKSEPVGVEQKVRTVGGTI